MGLNFRKLEVYSNNSEVLKNFIDTLNEEKETFRYFDKRHIDVINDHIYTCLLLVDDQPIAYGHLDRDDDTIWLGIVVKKNFQGKGASRKMMSLLLNKARELELNHIQLSVDKNNEKAIALYKKYGFEMVSKNENSYFLRKRIVTIGVSTLAFGKMPKEDVVKIAKNNNWIIEFSSSFSYDENMVSFFNRLHIKRLAHNYFPAPKDPFVMNLGSVDSVIRERTIAHCIQGLKISKEAGSSYYSAHAGFCIDPNPEQLGEPLDVNVPISRELNWKVFIESIRAILIESERLSVSFLIENNVTAKFNLRDDGQEVLFCSRPEELLKLYNEIDSNYFGILLDTAHLKVSSQALNFDLNSAVEELKPIVKYIHHSDNDGFKDTNESIDSAYWFLQYLKHFKECIHILEVKNIDDLAIENQINLISGYKS